eukprot:Rmarinus@m.9734
MGAENQAEAPASDGSEDSQVPTRGGLSAKITDSVRERFGTISEQPYDKSKFETYMGQALKWNYVIFGVSCGLHILMKRSKGFMHFKSFNAALASGSGATLLAGATVYAGMHMAPKETAESVNANLRVIVPEWKDWAVSKLPESLRNVGKGIDDAFMQKMVKYEKAVEIIEELDRLEKLEKVKEEEEKAKEEKKKPKKRSRMSEVASATASLT